MLITTGLTTGLITAPLASAAVAGGPAGLGHPGWDGPGGWWVVFPIAWFVLIAAAVTAFVVLGRRRGRLSGQRAGERRLAERYAAGEIDEDEYRARLTTLKTTNRT